MIAFTSYIMATNYINLIYNIIMTFQKAITYTITRLLSGNCQVNEQCSICHFIFILDLSSEILGFLKKILHV